MSFFENTKKPTGLGGSIMVSMMNMGHRALADWGFSFLPLAPDAAVLDCGCGGGANLEVLLKRCPSGSVTGLDYSPVSVKKSQSVNQAAIQAGRCTVLQGNVMALPFEPEAFDVVTAFETVYFWPDLAQSFREIHRVLKPQGKFFLCNECSGKTQQEKKWTDIIDGMTIYSSAELQALLESAGFHALDVQQNDKGWLCILAEKNA